MIGFRTYSKTFGSILFERLIFFKIKKVFVLRHLLTSAIFSEMCGEALELYHMLCFASEIGQSALSSLSLKTAEKISLLFLFFGFNLL
jgi:hypothetical protein